MSEKAVVTNVGMLDLRACVPRGWSDSDATDFVNTDTPAGTDHGWQMKHDGDPTLSGDPERVACSSRTGFVHIMFEC